MRDLSRLFRPKSIVVFGGSWAENVITQCQKIGFEGDIWPVHPTRDEICGVPCFRAIADLPYAPDAAFLGINRHAVIDITAELSDLGCGGAVCFAAGFSETGDTELQQRLIDAAGDMPLLGPNCYGFLNYLDGAVLWPDQHGGAAVDTGVAIISQSSNIVINISMQTRGLPIAYITCVGNQAQTTLTDMTQTLLDDPRVTAAGLYIEGIIDPVEFAAMASATRQAGKYLVAIKSGKTEASQSAASSHTAALAGDAATSSAFLRQCGVFEVDTPEEMLELLKILHVFGPLGGNRITAMCCSGGEVGLIADLTDKGGLDWPAIPDANAKDLLACLGDLVTISNPLDYHTFIWGDVEKMTATFAAMMGNWVDASVLVIDFPRADRCNDETWHPAVAAMQAAAKQTGTKAILMGSFSEGISEGWATQLINDGIVPLCGLANGFRAIEMASAGHANTAWQPFAPTFAPTPLPENDLLLMDEADAKQMLSDHGIRCPRGAKASTIDDIMGAAKDLSEPLALKGLGHAHKSEAGLVRLGLSRTALNDAAAAMTSANGFLVEEMVLGPVAELLVGLRRDPLYGISLTIGMGGITAELLRDTQTLVLPVTDDEIAAAIDQLQMAPLLHGYRGSAAADCSAAISAISAMASLISTNPQIAEIEVNPLMLGEIGKGVTAADAVIWINSAIAST